MSIMMEQEKTSKDSFGAQGRRNARDWAIKRQLRLHGKEQLWHYTVGNMFWCFSLYLAAYEEFNGLQTAALIAACGFLSLNQAIEAMIVRRNNIDDVDLDSEIGRIGKSSTVHAVLWGVTVSGIILWVKPQNIGLIGMLAIALMLGAGSVYGSVKSIILNIIYIKSAIIVIALIYDGRPEAWICAWFLMVADLIVVVLYNKLDQNTLALHLQAAKIQQTSDTVKLLLNDFEEQGADWLWECDGEGMITNPSPRFQQVSDKTPDELSAMQFANLFESGSELEDLEATIFQAQSFRDIIVPVLIAGEKRWWRLSGRSHITVEGVIDGMRGVATDVTAQKSAEAKVAYMAHYDGLTHLPNRTLFTQTLERAFSRKKDGEQFAVLYLDLDHFKSINDTLGHHVGDLVLKSAAERIEKCLDIQDMVARLGGDEFGIFLPNIKSRDDVQKTAAAIIEVMAEAFDHDGQPVVAGASLGVAYAPEDGGTVADIMKSADLALYNAKENGRSRTSVFNVSMHEALQERRVIEMDLRLALSRNELELYYQPLVNIETGVITSYEALLRWNHATRGIIMPTDFIPIAEETGLIVQLGEWVIRSALDEARRWPESVSVSVNLSPTQIRSPNLIPTIVNALANSGVATDRLELEITESVLMQESEENMAILHNLRALGVRIALDDFGTGYSSLNYLRGFPFDKIKIDRCFVDDVDNRDDCQAIVRAVTGLANSLGMVTTAEGVEREEQLTQLKSDGCTEVQGYYFSRPMPAGHVIERSAEPTTKHQIKSDGKVQKPQRDVA